MSSLLVVLIKDRVKVADFRTAVSKERGMKDFYETLVRRCIQFLETSVWRNYGVVQGPHLGPVRFRLYSNDVGAVLYTEFLSLANESDCLSSDEELVGGLVKLNINITRRSEEIVTIHRRFLQSDCPS